jgi:hypothetical protein
MSYWWNDLVAAIRALFSQALPVKGYDKVAVLNTMGRPQVASNELLVYIIPSRAQAVVPSGFPHAQPGVNGTTAWDQTRLTGSEVYVSGQASVQDVARLVVHEAFHNKLHLPDAVLHNKKGTGIAQDPMVPTLLPGDIALLKQAMVALVPQWLGGWDVASDPLRKL